MPHATRPAMAPTSACATSTAGFVTATLARPATRPGSGGGLGFALEQLGADIAFEHLSDLGARQVRPDVDPLGCLHAADFRLHEGDDLFRANLVARMQLN